MGISGNEGKAERVFMSYVREDAERVGRLSALLRTAGITVWLDTADLAAGEDWRRAIRSAIGDGMAFIACFSEHSLRKDRSFQYKELILAAEELQNRPVDRVWLLPVRFDDCRLPPLDLGLGRDLASFQRVDLFDHSSWDDGIARLVASIRGVRGQGASRTTPPGNAGGSRRHATAWGQPPTALGPDPCDRLDFASLFSRGGPVDVTVRISAQEMVSGTIVPVYVRTRAPCPGCGSTGAASGAALRRCPKCDGTGKGKHGNKSIYSDICVGCRGRGFTADTLCPACDGDGRARRLVQVRIPPGVKSRQRLKVPRQGPPPLFGAETADLYIQVLVT